MLRIRLDGLAGGPSAPLSRVWAGSRCWLLRKASASTVAISRRVHHTCRPTGDPQETHRIVRPIRANACWLSGRGPPESQRQGGSSASDSPAERQDQVPRGWILVLSLRDSPFRTHAYIGPNVPGSGTWHLAASRSTCSRPGLICARRSQPNASHRRAYMNTSTRPYVGSSGPSRL